MSKLGIFVSGTIVLFFAHSTWASPTHEVPPSKSEENLWPQGQNPEDMSIASPPPLANSPQVVDSGYYNYHQALTVRGGQSFKFPKMDSAELVIGVLYEFPKFLSPKLEAGADVHEEGKGHIHAGMRWYWREKSYFRPSYKLGVDHLVDAKENLATLTQLENYYFRASGTLEYMFNNPWAVRLEPEMLANFSNQKIVITLGLTRAW